MAELIIKDLHVSVNDIEILKGIDLTVRSNERHALMGPNGNGKSTLLQAIMGNPKYIVTKGSITFDGQDVLSMEVDERSKVGLFLGMQYPSEISGVTNSDFLRSAINARREKPISLFKFIKEMDKLGDKYGIFLPKGANYYVEDVGIKLVNKYGEKILHDIAKLNFSNTDRILKEVRK